MPAKTELSVIQNAIAERGIDQPTWSALQTSIYAGASDESILMVVDYCRALKLDPMQKPVHIVPMSVKTDKGYVMKDVCMAGIGLYRIQAARSGDMAGTSSPVFGPKVTEKLGTLKITYPEYCEVTVTKLIDDREVTYTAREMFIENYATKSRNDNTPNAMWSRRPFAQLAKCAEAQALRKGWPEIGQSPTFEEMEGKTEREITPVKQSRKSLIQEAAEVPDDMSWFDDLLFAVENADSINDVNTIYADALKKCETHKNNEATEHIKLACKQKLQTLEAS
jgi:phage recombination protein Bet